jgi:hypothetical protein
MSTYQVKLTTAIGLLLVSFCVSCAYDVVRMLFPSLGKVHGGILLLYAPAYITIASAYIAWRSALEDRSRMLLAFCCLCMIVAQPAYWNMARGIGSLFGPFAFHITMFVLPVFFGGAIMVFAFILWIGRQREKSAVGVA